MAIYKEDIVDIELESGTIHRSWLMRAIGLGDAKGNRFGVRLLRNGEPVNVGSATVTGLFMAPNGTNYVINESQVSGSTWIDGNVAGVILPSGCYAVEGQFCLAIKLSQSGVVTTMRIIDGMVSNTGTTGAVVPSSNIPTGDQIIAAYQQAMAVIDNSVRYDVSQELTNAQMRQSRLNINAAGMALMAPKYSASSTYAVGDHVHYDGYYYVCNTAITTAEEWTAAHWTQVTVGGEVSDLKSAITQEFDRVTTLSENVLTNTTVSRNNTVTIPDTGVANSRIILEFTVPAGQAYHIKLTYGNTISQIAAVYSIDANNTKSTIKYSPASGTDYTISASQTEIVAFSVYIQGTDISAATDLTFEVYYTITNNNSLESKVNVLMPDHAFFEKTIVFTDGYKVRADTGVIEEDSVYSYTELSVAMLAGSSLTGYSNASPWPNQGLAFYDAEGKFISGAYNQTSGYDWNISVIIPSNAFTLRISCRTAYKDDFKLTFQWNKSNQNIENAIKIAYDNNTNLETVNRILADTFIPVLRNGSAGNTGNANSISTDYVYPIDFTKNSIFIEYTGDASLADHYAWGYCKFSGATDGMKSATAFSDTSITKAQYNNNANQLVSVPWFNLPTKELTGYDHIMFFLFRYKDGSQVPLRIATDQYSFRVTWRNNGGIEEYHDIDFSETKHDLLYAKHATGNTGTRLTLLHFSDLHKDTGALARIMDDSKFFAYDDAICTGDMVDNAYEQISSWWDASVLTCIGNHDSASYSNGTYNWTALSMANRSAYYIEPFESGWGITHTSGKSYYYKDYSDAKVRLIVMDAMLYTDNGQDATDQTTWLSGLLSSAITNNLHVLIAIHAPHGGATAEDCSFSRYGQTEMPTHTDCNTPQAVIDAVSSAITSGLHFIGYIVGHTHQDNVWDAEGDGKQLMYCITCASVSNANQWKNSDQHRDTENDAYNIITIDTTNSLVKIIRGGGANIDDHMRTRKAICFDYSTGEKVGEVL